MTTAAEQHQGAAPTRPAPRGPLFAPVARRKGRLLVAACPAPCLDQRRLPRRRGRLSAPLGRPAARRRSRSRSTIAGRSALMTGAASGIGLAYAECMAEAGARVTLTDIDAEGAEREAARLVAEGFEARWAACDVADLDQVAKPGRRDEGGWR